MTQDKQNPNPQDDETTRHEQEDAASRDYQRQRDGGFKKKATEKPKQTPP